MLIVAALAVAALALFIRFGSVSAPPVPLAVVSGSENQTLEPLMTDWTASLGRRSGLIGMDATGASPDVWRSEWGADLTRDIAPVPTPGAGAVPDRTAQTVTDDPGAGCVRVDGGRTDRKAAAGDDLAAGQNGGGGTDRYAAPGDAIKLLQPCRRNEAAKLAPAAVKTGLLDMVKHLSST